MKQSNQSLLLFIVMIMSLLSCSKEVLLETEDESKPANETKSTLIVRTRTGTETTGEAVISYPVNIYVFDSLGECVATTTIDTEGSPVSLTLAEGTYNVYAIAGASAESYNLPSMESARESSVIALKDGMRHGDLMTAKNNVTLTDGETNTLTLSLARKVMLLQEVTINNVPEAVTAVAVTISPLYENLCVNGSFSGTNGAQSVALSKQDDSNVWKSTDEIYLLAASDFPTVSVKMETDSEINSYSYTCTESLEANYKITIEGTYTTKAGIELSGTIIGAQWAGVRNITFDFDDEGNATGKETVDNEGGAATVEEQIIEGVEVPAVMTVYNGTVVLSVEPQNDNTTIVTVLSPKQSYKTQLDFSDQTQSKASIDILMADCVIEGINVWRLPTFDELDFIISKYSEINAVLSTMETKELVTEGMDFFYQKSDGTISAYNITNGEIASENLNRSRLRAVATLRFK